ncbi:MAG: hypothetical protein J6M16_06570, partial [Clostridia bacterium]|nr:hypothetical protein [Clostridia bacterium]
NSAPLQGELSRKLLAVYETEGLLLRLVVVLFYNPSVIFFENATSPCRGGENRAGDCATTPSLPTVLILLAKHRIYYLKKGSKGKYERTYGH